MLRHGNPAMRPAASGSKESDCHTLRLSTSICQLFDLAQKKHFPKSKNLVCENQKTLGTAMVVPVRVSRPRPVTRSLRSSKIGTSPNALAKKSDFHASFSQRKAEVNCEKVDSSTSTELDLQQECEPPLTV